MRLIAEKLKSKIPVASLFISIFVAWLVLPFVYGFPIVAFFIFFVSVSSLVYLLREEKTWFDTWLYVGILALSFFLIYRANGFLLFFDFIFIIFFGSLLIRPLLKEHDVFSIIFTPLQVMKQSFLGKNIFPYIFKIPKKYSEKNVFSEFIPTILITILIIAITIPLLASANPFFNNTLQNILKFFNLDWLFKFIFAESLEIYFLRNIVFFLLIYWIPRLLTVSVQGINASERKQYFSINYLIPKTAIAGLLVIFFTTQIQLYFASNKTLLSMGYANSRLTNEVFFQVTIVAFIVFLLAYFDKNRKKWNTLLTYFLTVEAFFLIGIAFKSVYDYSSLNGFTQKRLWGYASMSWLTGAFILFIFYYIKQFSHLRFAKQILAYTVTIILLINLLNFDYLIAHVSKPTVAGAIDYIYLSRLSPDGQNYKEILTIAQKEAEKEHYLDAANNSIVYQVLNKIEFLKNKYGTRNYINTFNFAEYKEYLAVKDIDKQGLINMIDNTRQKYTPQSLTPVPSPTQ